MKHKAGLNAFNRKSLYLLQSYEAEQNERTTEKTILCNDSIYISVNPYSRGERGH